MQIYVAMHGKTDHLSAAVRWSDAFVFPLLPFLKRTKSEVRWPIMCVAVEHSCMTAPRAEGNIEKSESR